MLSLTSRQGLQPQLCSLGLAEGRHHNLCLSFYSTSASLPLQVCSRPARMCTDELHVHVGNRRMPAHVTSRHVTSSPLLSSIPSVAPVLSMGGGAGRAGGQQVALTDGELVLILHYKAARRISVFSRSTCVNMQFLAALAFPRGMCYSFCAPRVSL